MKTNNTTKPEIKVSAAEKPKKPKISFAGIRWDRMTDSEIAAKVFNDPVNQGAIRTKSIKNFHVTVFLKRKKLIAEGKNAAFAGRTVVTAKGEKVKKDKWVRAKAAPSVQ